MVRRSRKGGVWLETAIGDVPAAVIPRLRANRLTYDIVVFTHPDIDFDPNRNDFVAGWVEDGSELVIPRLGHGYLFAGFRPGALLATTYESPSLERVVGGLWDLAVWARKPWRCNPVVDWRAHDRREQRHAHVLRIADVAILTLAVVLLRRWI